MKTTEQRIAQRLRRDRPMTTISIRIPDDVIEDLKEIAPHLGFSGYQPLIRAYIGQGLRKDLAKFNQPEITNLEENLRRHGVREEVIAAVLGEAANRSA
jgi:predicted transcriptional regulator